jgi:class 3 adenylate cyclase/tetratricopeptide (TPR) repeat protein
MICSSCGTENRPGRKFCAQCATPLATICPACGAANDPGDRFCGECAVALPAGGAGSAGLRAAGLAAGRVTTTTPPSATATPGPISERRLVSVLFADLVGFTPFAEERDPEEVRETLSRYFELASETVGRYGGTVEKFIGDAVMAVWGAPVAHEDDAERAVRAALELVATVAALGPPIQARAGVMTGEAAVTVGATNQGMVAGDLVNTASRLQSVAPPGGVFVGEATHRAASRAIAFEAAGEQSVKGKSGTVTAWRALRVVAEVGGRNRSEALEAPFVGRSEELRLLKDTFHATSRDRRSRAIGVIGPAGIGKTRLAWEFLKYADGLVETVWWHEGRSPAYGDGITFWALGEMVRARCGLLETDDEPTTRAKVASTLERFVHFDDEREWIEQAILTLLGIGSGAPTDQLFSAWRTFFERLADEAPVIMVFEDFHHADAGLVEFIDHLLERSRNHPIVVITLARPELLDRFPDWATGKRNFISIHLDPLGAEAMTELLAGLVPGLPASAASAIVAQADGIPLYAVETVRVLVADGRLSLRDGVYVPHDELTDLAVPETLTALIASRLDGLPAADRSIVSAAAVLGQSFTVAGLAAVAGVDESDLEPRLRTLVRQEIFRIEADPRSPERGQFVFVQALVREVAYRTLSRVDRTRRHVAAARYFESLDSTELAGALSGQYLAAFQNATSTDEAAALKAQARVALGAAGARAAALGSPDEGVRFLDQALTVTDDPAAEADFLERAGAWSADAAHYEAAIGYLERALALQREVGDRLGAVRVLALLGTALLTGRQNDLALELLTAASDEFADLWPDRSLIALRSQLARAHMLREDNRQSIEIIEPVLEVAERTNLLGVLADGLVTKGTALDSLGRTREGLAVIATGEAVALEADLAVVALRGLNNRIVTQRWVDPRACLAAAREGVEIAWRIGNRSYAFDLMEKVSTMMWATGDWDGILATAAAGLAGDPEPGNRVAFLWVPAQVRVSRGEPIAPLLDPLLEALEAITDPQIKWVRAQAEAYPLFVAGRLPEAARAWREGARKFDVFAPESLFMAAVASLRSGDGALAAEALHELEESRSAPLQAPVILARRTLIQAGLAALDGDRPGALSRFETALRTQRDLGMPFEEVLTALVMRAVLDPATPEVRIVVQRARDFLTAVSGKPFLDQLESVLDDVGPTAQREASPAVGAQARS